MTAKEIIKTSIIFSRRESANFTQTAENIISNLNKNGFEIKQPSAWKTDNVGGQNRGIWKNCKFIADISNNTHSTKYNDYDILNHAIAEAIEKGKYPMEGTKKHPAPKKYGAGTTKEEAKAIIDELIIMCEMLDIQYQHDEAKQKRFEEL
jgi:hypothetical protein